MTDATAISITFVTAEYNQAWDDRGTVNAKYVQALTSFYRSMQAFGDKLRAEEAEVEETKRGRWSPGRAAWLAAVSCVHVSADARKAETAAECDWPASRPSTLLDLRTAPGAMVARNTTTSLSSGGMPAQTWGLFRDGASASAAGGASASAAGGASGTSGAATAPGSTAPGGSTATGSTALGSTALGSTAPSTIGDRGMLDEMWLDMLAEFARELYS